MKERNHAIDCWRIVFCYLVVILHSCAFWEDAWFPFGAISVEFFLIVSGYLLNYSVETKNLSTWEYVKQKYSKIIPTAFLTAIILLIEKMLLGQNIYALLIGFFNDCTFLRMTGITSGMYAVNVAAWYLSSMLVALLVLHPLLRWNREFCAKNLFPLLTMLLVGLMIQQNGSIMYVTTASDPFFSIKCAIAEIAFGASLYEVTKILKTKELTCIGVIVLSVLEILGYGVTIYYSLGNFVDISAIVLFLLGVSIMISFSGKTLLTKALNRLVTTTYLGELSLSLYLSHMIVIEILAIYNELVTYYGYEVFMVIYLSSCTILAVLINIAVRYLHKFMVQLKIIENNH